MSKAIYETLRFARSPGRKETLVVLQRKILVPTPTRGTRASKDLGERTPADHERYLAAEAKRERRRQKRVRDNG